MATQSTSPSGTTQPGTINQPVTAPIPVAGTQREHPEAQGYLRQLNIGDLELESGVTLPQVTIGYETWGTLNEAGDNAILILRVKSLPALDALHDALITDCAKSGLNVDSGPFSPHITLARHAKTSPRTLAALTPAPLSFSPECAHVYVSARDEQDILRYTPLFSAPFRKS